jgi:hypothetical protein
VDFGFVLGLGGLGILVVVVWRGFVCLFAVGACGGNGLVRPVVGERARCEIYVVGRLEFLGGCRSGVHLVRIWSSCDTCCFTGELVK